MRDFDPDAANLTLASCIEAGWPSRPAEFDEATFLDADETSVHRPTPDQMRASDSQAQHLAHCFRHSYWQHRRNRTYRALKAAGASENRLDRFVACGMQAFVLQHKRDPSRYILASNRCHDRFCEACQRERRRALAAKIIENSPPGRLRFMTLTCRATDQPLRPTIERIRRAWSRLRRSLTNSNLLTGGIAFTEIAFNSDSRRWHVHLHILFQGKYIPQKQLRERWFRITKDSFVVDIRDLKSLNQAAQYLVKYASKGIAPSVWRDQERLSEAITTLSGSRTFAAFGDWHNSGMMKHSEKSKEWDYIGTLAEIVARHKNGDSTATQILKSILKTDAPEPLDIFPATPQTYPEAPP